MNLSSPQKMFEAGQQATSFFQSLLNASANGIVVTNAANNIILANRQFYSLLGQTPPEIGSANLITCLNKIDQAVALSWIELSRLAWRNQPATGVLVKANSPQGLKYLEVTICLAEETFAGETNVLVSTWRDVTQQEGIQQQLRAEIMAHRQTEARLERINRRFLNLGPDPTENIQQLTALLGELLNATCALYNRLENGFLFSAGQWQTPPDYNPRHNPEGHICFDVIKQKSDRTLLIRNLPETVYLHTDPNVAHYNLQTYLGKAVKRKDIVVGSVCAVFQKDFVPTAEDEDILAIIAMSLGLQEEHYYVEKNLKKYLNHNIAEPTVTVETNRPLQVAEERYKVLLASVTDYIYTVTYDENEYPIHTSHGPGCLAVTGYAQEEYQNDPYLWYRMVYPDDRQAVEKLSADIVQRYPVYPLEHRVIHKDGSIRWVRNTTVPKYNPQGKLLSYDGLITDITKRKLAETALLQRNRELELLNRTGNAFLSGFDLDEVLSAFLKEVRALLEVTACAAWLVDQTTGEIVCRQVADAEGEIIHGKRIAPGNGLVGWVIQHGTSLNVPDVLIENRHIKDIGHKTHQQIRSVLTVPLKAKETIIGALQLADSAVDRFSSTDQILLETLATATAGAIQQTRLYETVRTSQEYTRNIIDSSMDMIITVDCNRNIVEFNHAARKNFGYQPEEVIGRHIDLLYANWEESKRIHELTIQRGQVMQEIQNKRKNGEIFPSILSASVLLDSAGKLVGAMGISRDITLRKQAEHERERLLAAEHQQRLLVETLSEMTLALTSQISLEAVLEDILRHTQKLVPYTSANISLLQGQTLHPVRWHGQNAPNEEENLSYLAQPLSDFLIDAEVVTTRKPLVIEDVTQYPNWLIIQGTEWIRSCLFMPICHHERVLGLLQLGSHVTGKFLAQDAERLQPIANAAAIALQNAQLYQNALEDAQTKLVLINEINHRVKNNLAAIIGLLYTEQQNTQIVNQATFKMVMKKLINRVQGLATVHSLLSASEWKPLRLSDLAQQIVYAVLRAYPHETYEVTVEIPPSPIKITAEQANNLTMILNELATNTMKYATPPPGESINIVVRINLFNNVIRLEYKDNGPGYPEEVLNSNPAYCHTGCSLLHNLTLRNLQGSINLHNNHGAVTAVQFNALVPPNSPVKP